jgi:DNA-binding CsgD family transcriptional regulator
MTALTKRETAVMRLVCEGLTAQGIGERLGISSRTVEVHRRSAVLRLGARNQTHAAVLFDRAHPPAQRRAVMGSELDKLARGLTALDRERITGWQGPAGAAYNAISEDLCSAGVLNRDWSLSPLGLALKAHIERNEG